MTWYVGLTDNPSQRRVQHGNPPDWQQTTLFNSESEARAWEAKYVGTSGYQGGTGGAGWRYGYWYTITSATKQ